MGHGMPADLLKIPPYIKDPRPDYAGYLHVIETSLEQGAYRCWFWELRSEHLISGPDSVQPTLWLADSRLFIAPSAIAVQSDSTISAIVAARKKDNAAYYVWD